MKKYQFIKEDTGSIVLEALLSLFVWMAIVTAVIPSFMYLIEKREELHYTGKAIQIVNEQYLKWLENEPFDRDIYFQGLSFHIQVGETVNHGKEICVLYHWKNRIERSVCRKIFQEQ